MNDSLEYLNNCPQVLRIHFITSQGVISGWLLDFLPTQDTTATHPARFVLPLDHIGEGHMRFGFDADHQRGEYPYEAWFVQPGTRYGRWISPKHMEFSVLKRK